MSSPNYYHREPAPSWSLKQRAPLASIENNARKPSTFHITYFKNVENEEPSPLEISPTKSELQKDGDKVFRVFTDQSFKYEDMILTIHELEDRVKQLEQEKIDSAKKVKHQIGQAIDDTHRRLSSNFYPAEKLKVLLVESDQMLVSLMSEMESLNKLLHEKIKSNETLKETNKMLEDKFWVLTDKLSSELDKVREEKRNEVKIYQSKYEDVKKENNRLVEVREHLLKSNKNHEKELATLRAEVEALKKQSASAKGLETTSPRLVAQIDELLTTNDGLNIALLTKEDQLQQLNQKVLDLGKINESLGSHLQIRAAELDDLRAEFTETTKKAEKLEKVQEEKNSLERKLEILESDFTKLQEENLKLQEENVKCQAELATLRKSNITMESTKVNDIYEKDVKEMRRRCEMLKQDNAKLTSIIAGNQQIINDFRVTFSSLESNHGRQIEDLRNQYENRIKKLTESLTSPIITNNNTLGSYTSLDGFLSDRAHDRAH